jgi:Protein of unknown function (DUF789)
VAWYPAYRIPDAPLNARFLTFHSVVARPQPDSLRRVGAGPAHVDSGRSPSASRWCLPVVGAPLDPNSMKRCHWEPWMGFGGGGVAL